MRILITGGTGFIGTFFLSHVLSQHDRYHVLSLARRPHELFSDHPRFQHTTFDLSDFAANRKAIREFRPDAVLHLGAISTPALAEGNVEETTLINIEFTKLLAELCAELQAHLCFASTDLVFDGRKAPPGGWREEDTPQPACAYSKSKVAGEKIILKSAPGACIMRIALAYGPPLGGLGGFLMWMREKFEARERVPLFEDEWRSPTYVMDVVRAAELLLTKQAAGIFHCAGPERVNRVELGRIFCEVFGYDQNLIWVRKRQDVELTPPRPEDTTLCSEKMAIQFGMKFLAVAEGLRALTIPAQ